MARTTFFTRVREGFIGPRKQHATAGLSPVDSQVLTSIKALTESLNQIPLVGGLNGGNPNARRGGQDAPAIINEAQLMTYRAIARWAYEQNEYYGGLIDRLVDYQAGKGFAWEVAESGRKFAAYDEDEPAPPEVTRAQAVLDSFTETDGRRSRDREECRRVLRDGESFRRIFVPSLEEDDPQCRFVEPEHITAPPPMSGYEEWKFGVLALKHDAERHLAYFVKAFAEDTGEAVLAAGVRWGEIPERLLIGLQHGPGCIIHRKESRSDRSVKRGLPLFWGGTDGLEQAESLIDNLTAVAAFLSTVAYYREHAPGVSGAEIVNFQDRIKRRQEQQQADTSPTVSLLPFLAGLVNGITGFLGANGQQVVDGPRVVDVTNGMTYVPPPVQSNIAAFLSVLQARIRAACVLAGAPEYLGTGDPSNQNYASIKEAGSPFVVATEGRQADAADSSRRVAMTVLLYAGADSPIIKVNVVSSPVAMKPDLDQAQIRATDIQAGILSPQQAIRAAGRDPKQTQKEILAWKSAMPDEGGPMLPLGDESGSNGDAGGSLLDKLKSRQTNGAPLHESLAISLAESRDDSGHEHKGSGPGGGQFVSKGGGGRTTQPKIKQSPQDSEKTPKKLPATRGEMQIATRTGKGKDAKVVLADGKDAPSHIKPSMVPPNWTDVQVSLDRHADLQVTGRDAKGRPKAVYRDEFHMRIAAVKFARVQEGLTKADSMAAQNEANRSDPKLKENADCVWLMMEQATRPGSDSDTGGKVKAYGATTLEGRHVVKAEDGVRLRFVGKEGVFHDHLIRNKDLADMLLERSKAAGENGKLFETNYAKVVDYTKEKLDGGAFTPKDFRTIRATKMAIATVNEMPVPTTEKQYKIAVRSVATKISGVLGNRPAQALESYIAPEVFSGWRAQLGIASKS